MREIKKYVRYHIENRKSWADQSPQRPRNIELYFSYDGKRYHDTTGMKVALCDWDDQRQRVKLTVKRAAEVNHYLDKLEERINDIYFSAKAEWKVIDNTYIKKELKQGVKQVRPDFFNEWLKFVEINKNRFANGTIKSMMTAYNRFKEFTGGKVSFEDVNPELLSNYAAFLLSAGNVNITVHGNIKRMKIFMNYAKDMGLHSNDSYKRFKVSVKEPRKLFLDWNEVRTLFDYKPVSEFERKVLDKFLFGCLTTMRFSDYNALKKDDIQPVTFEGDEQVYNAAHLRHKKTSNMTVVPLLPEAMTILDRYKDLPGANALPKVGSHVINRHIKLIAKKAGITAKVPKDYDRGNARETKYYEKWELLGTHIGRKSGEYHETDPLVIMEVDPGLIIEIAPPLIM